MIPLAPPPDTVARISDWFFKLWKSLQNFVTNSIYIDTTNGFVDRSALITTTRSVLNPVGIVASLWQLVLGNGDNSTFRGVSCGYFKAQDKPGIAASQRGVLYGLQLSVSPSF